MSELPSLCLTSWRSNIIGLVALALVSFPPLFKIRARDSGQVYSQTNDKIILLQNNASPVGGYFLEAASQQLLINSGYILCPLLCSAGSGSRRHTTMADQVATSTPAPPSRGKKFAEVVVVRHGETSWNASHIIQGQMDPELNETGRQQALVVARRLSREAKPAAVYSSDLRRAAETAQAIATACGVSNLVFDPALRERHMGDLHGLVYDVANRRNPEVFSSEQRTQEIPGGGESLDQLSRRCVSYLNTVAEKHKGDRVIVVTHGASTEELCLHADPTCPVRGKLQNTSICLFRIGGGEWILHQAGDVGHLGQGGFLEDAFGGDTASA